VSAEGSRGLLGVILVLSIALLFIGSAFSLTLPATVAIEGLVVLIYAIATGQQVLPWLTFMLLVNLLTQPVLWFAMERCLGRVSYVSILAAAESVIWLAEAGLLYLLRGGRLALKGALLLSLAMNAVSCGVGLLLPV
jgi:hypothetical protein